MKETQIRRRSHTSNVNKPNPMLESMCVVTRGCEMTRTHAGTVTHRFRWRQNPDIDLTTLKETRIRRWSHTSMSTSPVPCQARMCLDLKTKHNIIEKGAICRKGNWAPIKLKDIVSLSFTCTCKSGGNINFVTCGRVSKTSMGSSPPGPCLSRLTSCRDRLCDNIATPTWPHPPLQPHVRPPLSWLWHELALG